VKRTAIFNKNSESPLQEKPPFEKLDKEIL
jgi:hypothetical protein